jgi:hypothetical protein
VRLCEHRQEFVRAPGKLVDVFLVHPRLLCERVEGLAMLVANLLVQLVDGQLDGLEGLHRPRADLDEPLVGVHEFDLSIAGRCQRLRGFHDPPVQQGFPVLLVRRVHRGDNQGLVLPGHGFHEPQRVVQLLHELPVGIGERRALCGRVVVGSLHDEHRIEIHRPGDDGIGNGSLVTDVRGNSQPR